MLDRGHPDGAKLTREHHRDSRDRDSSDDRDLVVWHRRRDRGWRAARADRRLYQRDRWQESADCLVARGKKPTIARYWEDLLVGDSLIAKGDCRMEIMPRDGPRRWTIMATNSPTEITARAQRSGPLPKELEPIGVLLNAWNDALQPPEPPPPKKIWIRKAGGRAVAVMQPVTLKAAAPPPLAMPLLSGPVRQRLVAEPRHFNLAWIGGKQPFSITVTGPEEGAPDGPPWVFQIGEERLVSSTITLECVGLVRGACHRCCAGASGGWLVRGGDNAAGRRYARSGQSSWRHWPRAHAGARLANRDRRHVAALEAHARLADEGRDNYAAALMAGQLAAGKDLPDLPAPPIAAASEPGAAAR